MEYIGHSNVNNIVDNEDEHIGDIEDTEVLELRMVEAGLEASQSIMNWRMNEQQQQGVGVGVVGVGGVQQGVGLGNVQEQQQQQHLLDDRPHVVIANHLLGVSSPTRRNNDGINMNDQDLDRPQLEQVVGGDNSAEQLEGCPVARTVLLIPFHFHPNEDPPPVELTQQLLSRSIVVDGETIPLWERDTIPADALELSTHFRLLLDGSLRLSLTQQALTALFSDARLWTANAATGQFTGRHVEWTRVQLVVSRHCALLSFGLNWITSKNEVFTLSDLRTWVYLSKFRSVRAGVTQGWSFRRHELLHDPVEVKRVKDTLGEPLYAAIYGGSNVTLGWIANWLVKMPSEDIYGKWRRTSRQDYCQHHTFAQVWRRPKGERLDRYLFHIRKAHGPGNLRPLPSAAYLSRFSTDQVLPMSERYVIGFAREGVFGLEWGPDVALGSRRHLEQFHGIFYELCAHCLLERTTLERLSYFAAIQAQHLSLTNDVERERLRAEFGELSSQLLRYRTVMACDDCGGSVEVRKFFKILRYVHSIAVFKQTLFDQFQDAKYIMDCERREERTSLLEKDRKWIMRKEQISLEQEELTQRPKLLFDLLFFAFIAVTFPFILISTMWGSNQDDLPRGVHWSSLVIAAAVSSAVFLIAFGIFYMFARRHIKELERERRAHLSLVVE